MLEESKMKKVIIIIIGIFGVILSAAGIFSASAGDIGVIGGADGPTAVFVAGKPSAGFTVCLIIAGIVLLIAAAFIIFKRRH